MPSTRWPKLGCVLSEYRDEKEPLEKSNPTLICVAANKVAATAFPSADRFGSIPASVNSSRTPGSLPRIPLAYPDLIASTANVSASVSCWRILCETNTSNKLPRERGSSRCPISCNRTKLKNVRVNPNWCGSLIVHGQDSPTSESSRGFHKLLSTKTASREASYTAFPLAHFVNHANAGSVMYKWKCPR